MADDLPQTPAGERTARLEREVAELRAALAEAAGEASRARAAAEARLRENEDHYWHAVELNPHTTWTAAPDGQLDRVSARWMAWTGTSGLGDTWAQGLHEDDRARTFAVWGRSVATGEPYDIEHRVKMRDGGYRWMHSRAYPRRDEQGRIVKWYGTTEDVHERRVAEDALRDSEARFQAIADSIDQMVWSTRPDGFHDYYNQRWYDYTGVPQGSTDGEAWSGMFHPEDQERAWEVWRRSLETGEPYHIEYRLRRSDGDYRWVLGRAQPVRDADGRITRWFGTCTDIEEIVEAREVLARSREELEQEVAERTRERNRVWEMSRDLLAVMGFDGALKAINPAWTATLGLDEETLLSRDFSKQVHPDDHPKIHAMLEDLRAGRTVERFEDRLRHADGDWRWISWTLVPGGEDVFYAVGRDVTAEKARAAELEAAQAALRQAQKMEAVGQLTGGIAHDFNNILTGISGSLEIVQRRLRAGRTDDVEKFAEAAIGATRRAAALTQRLLAYARRQALDPRPVEVNGLVRSMEDLLRRTLGEQITLRTELGSDLPTALCDAHQLENALLNLVINARDAMPEGGRLTVATGRADLDAREAAARHEVEPGCYVTLAVSDTGVGMTPDVVEKAFDPFFTTKPLGQGTGLGLSMLYGFVKQSGGHVTIDSRPGEGTTVTLCLPCATTDALAEEEPPAAEEPGGSGETVLVVEDEALVRMLVRDVLDDLGYAALEAADAAEALEQIEAGARIDLLVTDVGLPGMNGRQLADRARELRPDLKVLFITGYAHGAEKGEGLLEPGMEMIGKPFTLEALAQRIRAMIQDDPAR